MLDYVTNDKKLSAKLISWCIRENGSISFKDHTSPCQIKINFWHQPHYCYLQFLAMLSKSQPGTIVLLNLQLWPHLMLQGYVYKSILFPKFFWPTVRKNCSIDQEKLKAEGREFAKILGLSFKTIYSNSERSLQFLKQNVFLTCSLRILRSNELEHLGFKLEKVIGI